MTRIKYHKQCYDRKLDKTVYSASCPSCKKCRCFFVDGHDTVLTSYLLNFDPAVPGWVSLWDEQGMCNECYEARTLTGEQVYTLLSMSSFGRSMLKDMGDTEEKRLEACKDMGSRFHSVKDFTETLGEVRSHMNDYDPMRGY